jgi:hypothetical protein
MTAPTSPPQGSRDSGDGRRAADPERRALWSVGYALGVSPVASRESRSSPLGKFRGLSPASAAHLGYVLGESRIVLGLIRCNRPRSSIPVTETTSNWTQESGPSWAVTLGGSTL